jgi:hypothetical protein
MHRKVKMTQVEFHSCFSWGSSRRDEGSRLHLYITFYCMFTDLDTKYKDLLNAQCEKF